jgi:hypothetical protein
MNPSWQLAVVPGQDYCGLQGLASADCLTPFWEERKCFQAWCEETMVVCCWGAAEKEAREAKHAVM